jgi:UDP-N-acetylmuramoyl-tripeptide--D-alanyl-D-alanine ligase
MASAMLPRNRAPFTVEEVLAATGGRVLRRSNRSAVGVSTDSRHVLPGNVFVALVGARHDGHDHAAAAAAMGAAIVLVSREVEIRGDCSVIRVPDTTVALGALGRAHRRRWSARSGGARVVAITGSAGKTTTRLATAAILRGLGLQVLASDGNYNNQIGVPLTLLGLEAEHEVAVVEIGTSSPGEIAHGAWVSQPDIGVLTLVAAAHTERLGTVDDVAHEKGALLAALPPDGVAIVNGDNPHCAAQLLRSPARTWLEYGTRRDLDLRLEERVPDGVNGARLGFWWGQRTAVFGVHTGALSVHTPLIGEAGAWATSAALMVGAVFGGPRLTPGRVGTALASLGDEGGRLAARRLPDGTILIDDSYNANRASMEASLRTAGELARAEKRRLVAVLGEMRELGDLAEDEHRAVGEELARQGAAVLVAVGEGAQHIALGVSGAPGATAVHVIRVRTAAEAVASLKGLVARGDVVLVKGSRGVGLEAVATALGGPR